MDGDATHSAFVPSSALTVATLALFVYDYLLNLDNEIALVWGFSMKNTVSILFLIVRYVPFAATILQVYGDQANRRRSIRPIEDAFLYTGIICAESLLVLRTYAIWDRNKKVLWGLIVLTLILAGCAVPFTTVHDQNSGKASISFSLLIPFESILLGLTLYKMWSYMRGRSVSLVRMLWRDGIIYFVTILVASTANIIFYAAYPSQVNNVPILQLVFHSALSTRIVLHLRGKRREEDDSIPSDNSQRMELTTIYHEE